jgi:phage/plasmid-associated DNA primase
VTYPYDFQASRPITEYYREAQLACICPVARFMSALVNDEQCGEVKGKELYERYKSYVAASGYKNVKTATSFGLDIKRMKGVSSKRMSQGVVYRLNLEEIKAHLELTNQFDADASCM